MAGDLRGILEESYRAGRGGRHGQRCNRSRDREETLANLAARTGDSDNDRVCDDQDACHGNDVLGDADGDGECDDTDACAGDDATGDPRLAVAYPSTFQCVGCSGIFSSSLLVVVNVGTLDIDLSNITATPSDNNPDVTFGCTVTPGTMLAPGQAQGRLNGPSRITRILSILGSKILVRRLTQRSAEHRNERTGRVETDGQRGLSDRLAGREVAERFQ